MTKEKKQYRTSQIWIKKGHRMYPYFQQTCGNGKKLYNTTNFYIRQVYTALKTDKALHPLQEEVMDTLAKQLPKMNDRQLAAYQKKLAKESAKPAEKRKKVKANLFEMPSEGKAMLSYGFLDCLFKSINQNDYKVLPTHSAQGMMKDVFQNWNSFFASLKDYQVHPEKYKGKPRIPGYCKLPEKEVVFSNQECVVKDSKYLKFPRTKERLNIGKLGMAEGKLKEIRCIPKYGAYVIELVMDIGELPEAKSERDRYMAIDLGIDNLAAATTNTGRRPVLIKGTRAKSINQFYNKRKAHLLSVLRKGKQPNQGPFTSKRLERLSQKRHRKLKDIFHKASNRIIQIALEEEVDTIIIGSNKDWKQNSNIGKKNNQSFVSIPHSMLMEMLTYKAEGHGIRVLKAEESYTSKASFLDEDDIPVYEEGAKQAFSGRRIKRGLYRSKNGVFVNADVNGSANIMRKHTKKANLLEEVCLQQPMVAFVI